MKKQLISIITATAMTFSAVPFVVSAETTKDSDNIAISNENTEIVAKGNCGSAPWVLDSNGKLTISGQGETDDAIYYDYFKKYSDMITDVVVEDGITVVGESLFRDLKNLKSVILPESLSRIDSFAFANCEKLSEINIPKSVTNIKSYAFANTEWLNNKLAENQFVIENNILIASTGCKGDIIIPDGITMICCDAFRDSEVTSIKLPDSITRIDNGAFFNCNELTDIELPNTIEHISYRLFYNCTKLKEIEIPQNVKYIEIYSLGFYDGENGDEKIDSFTIKGYADSSAQTYAEENGFNFVALKEDSSTTTTTSTTSTTTTVTTTTSTATTTLSTVKGDVNLDGKLDLSDAVLIMQSLASPEKYGLNGTNTVHMTEQGKINGDIDKNGLTNADALEIQKYILRIHDSKYFQVNVNVIVTEITDESIIVTPVADSPELKSSDKFIVPLTAISDGTTPKVDSEYSIKYDGAIMETSPAQFVEIFDMRVVG